MTIQVSTTTGTSNANTVWTFSNTNISYGWDVPPEAHTHANSSPPKNPPKSGGAAVVIDLEPHEYRSLDDVEPIPAGTT